MHAGATTNKLKIMKTYCVNLKETPYGFVEVQADNEEEAKEIAYKAWLDGNANMVGSVDCEPLSVEES